MTGAHGATPRRSLFRLIADLPNLLVELVKGELELLKQELTAKLKRAGIGVGLLAVAAAFAFFALGVLVAAAVLGLATVLPGWAAALIVAGALLIVAAILILAGASSLKKSATPPTETIASVKKDVRTIKGIGK